MLTLRQIQGQPRAVALLRRAIGAGRVVHAYLFTGPAGCGKYSTGLALAAALNCLREPGEGCGDCDACAKIAAGIHPDVQTLERQGAAQIIPIETIRAQVIPQLGVAPHEGEARVFLIEEAASLQGAAANALLKTLEEPPRRTHFVLCTTSPEALLPTIRSRCQRISFAALPPDLRASLHQDSATAEQLGALVQSLRRAAEATDTGSLHRAAEEACAAKEQVAPMLELWAARLHEEARQAAMATELDQAARLGREAMAVLETQAAIARNAHGQLALEALIHALRAMP